MRRPGWLFSWLSLVPDATVKADVKTRYGTLQCPHLCRHTISPRRPPAAPHTRPNARTLQAADSAKRFGRWPSRCRRLIVRQPHIHRDDGTSRQEINYETRRPNYPAGENHKSSRESRRRTHEQTSVCDAFAFSSAPFIDLDVATSADLVGYTNIAELALLLLCCRLDGSFRQPHSVTNGMVRVRRERR